MCGGFALSFVLSHVTETPSFLRWPLAGHANKILLFPPCRRPCWRRPAGKALIHRRVTPTRPGFCALPAPMLASPSRQSHIPSSGHANKARPFPTCRRPCWRRPAGKALILRRATPTRPVLSRAAGAHVGVALPAKPLSSVEPRQQGAPNPAWRQPMLASPCRQSLNPSSGHANKTCPFPRYRHPCWRHPARRALTLRRATPTRPALSRDAGAHVGVALPAEP